MGTPTIPKIFLVAYRGFAGDTIVAVAVVSYAGLVPPMFLPTPMAVIQAGIGMFTQDDLLND